MIGRYDKCGVILGMVMFSYFALMIAVSGCRDTSEINASFRNTQARVNNGNSQKDLVALKQKLSELEQHCTALENCRASIAKVLLRREDCLQYYRDQIKGLRSATIRLFPFMEKFRNPRFDATGNHTAALFVFNKKEAEKLSGQDKTMLERVIHVTDSTENKLDRLQNVVEVNCWAFWAIHRVLSGLEEDKVLKTLDGAWGNKKRLFDRALGTGTRKLQELKRP